MRTGTRLLYCRVVLLVCRARDGDDDDDDGDDEEAVAGVGDSARFVRAVVSIGESGIDEF